MLAIVILIIGAGGLVAQTILLRELFVCFFGNELTIGLILGAWMFGEALGACAAAYAARRLKDTAAALTVLLVVFAVSLHFCAVGARLFKPLLNIPAGQGIGTAMILAGSFMLVLLPSFCHGGLFSLACTHTRPWRAYALETCGTLAAGIALTWWAIPNYLHFDIIRFVSIISICAGITRMWSMRGAWRKAILYPLAFGALLFFLNTKPAQVEQNTIARQYRQGKVLDQRNSWYGNAVVTQREGQKTFFYNGVPAVTAPIPDVVWSQDFAHFPLVFCEDPKDILVVNAGLGGLVAEILRQPVARVDYCQQDSLLADMLRKHPSRLSGQEFSDARLNVIHADARAFLASARHTYDAVYIGSSMPGDLASNRFFTDEFFNAVHSRLSPGGVAAVCLPGSAAYVSPELRDMNYMIINAISLHFSRVRVIPGNYNIILASDAADFTVKPAVLYKRLVRRGVRASMLNPAYLRERLAPGKADWFRQSSAGATGSVNSDDRPVAVYQVLILWNKQFSARTTAILQRVSGIRLWMVLSVIGLIAASAAAVSILRRRRGMKAAVLYAMATTGFFGMAMNLVLIFKAQSQFGHVYQMIGALTALFMAGAAAGSIAAEYATRALIRPLRAIGLNDSFSVLFCAVVFFLIGRSGAPQVPAWGYGALFFFSGMIVGAEFPLASGLYGAGGKSLPQAPGIVFSADLAGGVCAAGLAGVIFLPLLGTSATIIALAFLKATAALIIIIKNLK